MDFNWSARCKCLSKSSMATWVYLGGRVRSIYKILWLFSLRSTLRADVTTENLRNWTKWMKKIVKWNFANFSTETRWQSLWNSKGKRERNETRKWKRKNEPCWPGKEQKNEWERVDVRWPSSVFCWLVNFTIRKWRRLGRSCWHRTTWNDNKRRPWACNSTRIRRWAAICPNLCNCTLHQWPSTSIRPRDFHPSRKSTTSACQRLLFAFS